MAEGTFQTTEQGGMYQAELSCLAKLRFREAKGLKYKEAEMTENYGTEFQREKAMQQMSFRDQ